MLEKDFEYYLDNQNELKKEFNGSFVIIQNQNILGALPTIKDVYKFLDSKKGAFLIQEVNEEPDAQTALLSL